MKAIWTLFVSALAALGLVACGAGEGETPAESPTPGRILITMGDNFFISEGQLGPTIFVAVGEEVTFDLANNGQAIHNMHIAGTDNEYGVSFCGVGSEEPCSDPELITGGDTGTMTFQFDVPGAIIFRCDFHPAQMTGQIMIQ